MEFSFAFLQREYEEFKVKINVLVAKSQKKPEEGWVLQDGTPWPGNNTDDHPGMIQVCLISLAKDKIKSNCFHISYKLL
jgi:hypothetical protein